MELMEIKYTCLIDKIIKSTKKTYLFVCIFTSFQMKMNEKYDNVM